MSSYEINSIFAEIDINNNGYITYGKYIHIAIIIFENFCYTSICYCIIKNKELLAGEYIQIRPNIKFLTLVKGKG